jgi:hypothetical protein
VRLDVLTASWQQQHDELDVANARLAHKQATIERLRQLLRDSKAAQR